MGLCSAESKSWPSECLHFKYRVRDGCPRAGEGSRDPPSMGRHHQIIPCPLTLLTQYGSMQASSTRGTTQCRPLWQSHQFLQRSPCVSMSFTA